MGKPGRGTKRRCALIATKSRIVESIRRRTTRKCLAHDVLHFHQALTEILALSETKTDIVIVIDEINSPIIPQLWKETSNSTPE
jgi:hypothetical protein